MNAAGLSQLAKEGTIRRFASSLELGWKVMKDYLEFEGVALPQVTPRAVIREAFKANMTSDGSVWMDALDARNRMSHVYDLESFEKVVQEIRDRYLAAMEDLSEFLLAKEMDAT